MFQLKIFFLKTVDLYTCLGQVPKILQVLALGIYSIPKPKVPMSAATFNITLLERIGVCFLFQLQLIRILSVAMNQDFFNRKEIKSNPFIISTIKKQLSLSFNSKFDLVVLRKAHSESDKKLYVFFFSMFAFTIVNLICYS